MSHPLFPQYLDPGSKGAAVRWVQGLMQTFGYQIDEEELQAETYGPSTVDAVQKFQVDRLDFEGPDADGKFGPGTRRRTSKPLGIDVNKITAAPGEVTLAMYPEAEAPTRWPPEE